MCITLFSDLDEYFKNTKLSLIQLEVLFEHGQLSFPLQKYYQDDLYVSLHSPNTLPDFKRENSYQKLEMGMVNFITYSESRIKLLTKCTEYELKSDGKQNTRNDCIQKCVDNKLKQKYNLNCIWSYDNFKLMRQHNLFDQAEKSICNYFDEPRLWQIVDDQHRFTKLCHDICPANCLETSYSFQIETRKGGNYRKESSSFAISIEHKSWPDQIYEHRPNFEWIPLFFNGSALLGVLLGFITVFFFK